MPWIKPSLILLALSLASCGNIPAPEEGRTMRNIYDEQMTGAAPGAAQSLAPDATSGRPAQDAVPTHYGRYTRSVQTEIENLFPLLPNPTLFLYIRPHTVGRDQIPVPGYTVPIKMYERDQHAMPGETVPAESNDWEAVYE